MSVAGRRRISDMYKNLVDRLDNPKSARELLDSLGYDENYNGIDIENRERQEYELDVHYNGEKWLYVLNPNDKENKKNGRIVFLDYLKDKLHQMEFQSMAGSVDASGEEVIDYMTA
jgi:hypothetical protein